MSIRYIRFVDVTGQVYHFELNADEGIYSLVLVKGPKRGVQSLVINGETEVYHLRPKGIIDMIPAVA